jgi:hypothetical protein
VVRSSKSASVPEPPSAQSPFARRGCYPRRQNVLRLVRGRYPSFFAHTDSCARPYSSARLRFPSSGRSLQVAVSPCWKMALPDVISAVFVKAPGPLPRRVPVDAVRLCVLPTRLGHVASPDVGLTHESTGSARETIPVMATSAGGVFRGCSHSLMFRLPHLLGPQVAPTAVSLQGSRAVYLTQ